MHRSIVATVFTIMAVCFISSGVGVRAQSSSSGRGAAFAVYADRATQKAGLVSFQGNSGVVNARLSLPYFSATQSLDMLANAASNRLYLARLDEAGGGKAVNTPSILDAHSLKILANTFVPHRIMYKLFSNSTMALSPDGRKLFVYNYLPTNSNQTPRDWLTVLNARTLAREGNRIPLPGCDAEQMATTAKQIVIMCFGTSDLRFADPATRRVVRRNPLAVDLSSMTVSPGRRFVFVAGSAGQIAVIGSKDHKTLRVVNYQPDFGASVGRTRLAVSRDGRYLFVGLAHQTGGTALYVNVIELPSLRLKETLKMQPAQVFAAAPQGAYAFGAPFSGFPVSAPTTIQRLTPTSDGAQLSSLLDVPGLIYRFATPAQ
jgi:hypothetical protein